MPSRILREGIITSESVNKLSHEAELFYRRLMSVMDDYGRYYANPAILRPACYPLQIDRVSEETVKRSLNECLALGLLVLYDNGKHLYCPNFRQQRRFNSKFPEPTANNTLSERLTNASTTVQGVPNTTTTTPTNTTSNSNTDESEFPDFEEAFAMTMNVGVQEDFCRYVYDDWFTRQGRDASGVIVPWLKYVSKRWSREREQWVGGSHKGRGSSNPINRRPLTQKEQDDETVRNAIG
jgi:hypothetical protein